MAGSLNPLQGLWDTWPGGYVGGVRRWWHGGEPKPCARLVGHVAASDPAWLLEKETFHS